MTKFNEDMHAERVHDSMCIGNNRLVKPVCKPASPNSWQGRRTSRQPARLLEVATMKPRPPLSGAEEKRLTVCVSCFFVVKHALYIHTLTSAFHILDQNYIYIIIIASHLCSPF